jgi:hypothetical protein
MPILKIPIKSVKYKNKTVMSSRIQISCRVTVFGNLIIDTNCVIDGIGAFILCIYCKETRLISIGSFRLRGLTGSVIYLCVGICRGAAGKGF